MNPSPVRVITVEREYGSRGGEFAHDLAARLGWRLLDSELLTAAARRACVPEEAAARFDDRLDPWYYRYGKVFWQDQLYSTATEPEDKVFNCERMYALIKQEMLDQAKVGACVIVGRGGAAALAGKPGCFHIFVYATMAAKRAWFAQTFPERALHADQELASRDKRRAAAIKQYYGQEWCARGLYHMLLNSCVGFEPMIAAVEGAIAARQAVSQACAS
jgi:Cytidylate kinase-like family